MTKLQSTVDAEQDVCFHALFAGAQLLGKGKPLSELKNDAPVVPLWRKVYPKKLHQTTKEWCLEGVDWHVLSYD
jgi:hypothetical protein